ncbi:MAG: lysophospholipid acyltransferase family protein [Candidatus Cloacimonetes bacterium]|nr:lysophospholipid acyltransferase family protein [Candidatus Cloacimonadota bacterium]
MSEAATRSLRGLPVRLLSRLILALPWRALPPLARCIGWLWTYLIPVRRSLMRRNLDLAFPDKDAAWRRSVIRECCTQFALTGLELFWLPRMDRAWVDRHVRFLDPELPRRLLEQGKGLVCVGGHYGNWEVMGAATSLSGLPLSYIVKRVADPEFDRLVNDSRRSAGVEIIYTREAGRLVLKHLRRNRLVAFLSDQDARSRGIFVNFMGQPASTPQGAAVYALRLGTPMLFVNDRRLANGHHEIEFSQIPVDPDWTLCDEHVQALTQRFTTLLEERVRAHPAQWFWMHRRWKTQPVPPEHGR